MPGLRIRSQDLRGELTFELGRSYSFECVNQSVSRVIEEHIDHPEFGDRTSDSGVDTVWVGNIKGQTL